MRSQPCIITFMGPVGVGKSTHINLLRDYLKARNIRVVATFIKSSHGLSYILTKLIIAPSIHEKVSNNLELARTYSSGRIVKKLLPLYRFLDGVSIATKFFFTVYLPFRLGFKILIEEGLLMTLYTYHVSFPFFFKTERKDPPLVRNLLAYVTSKDHINIVFDARLKELEERRTHRGYREREMVEYISMQKKWIRNFDYRRTVFIDTTGKSIGEIRKKVITALESYGYLNS